jgi:xanthine dehydrogenase YagT iron-sulfur-binding subunit
MTISRRRFLILGAVTATAFAMPPFISLKAYAASLEQPPWPK